LFRRRDETLNERLLREAGYGPDGTKLENVPPVAMATAPSPPDAFMPLFPQADGLLGSSREPGAGHWDAVTIAAGSGLRDDAYEFATVPDGTRIVAETCDEDLSPFADAIEAQVQPPYRARAVRQANGMWLVSGRRIRVVELAAEGEELELSSLEGRRLFSVDGQPADPATAPSELAALGERRSVDYAVHASRIDGDLWEIEADPL